MGLDVSLTVPNNQEASPRQAIFVRRNGANIEITREEWDSLRPGVEPVMATINGQDSDTTTVYSDNITHNLTSMAKMALIYEHLWRPEILGIKKAAQLIAPLTDGLARLRESPNMYKKHDAPNGWGKYDDFVPFVENYLNACKANPDADVEADR